jgi:hypothetical protein
MRQHEVLGPAHQESHRQYRQGPNGDRREAVEQPRSGARWSPSLGDRLIGTIDADGAALAAIQALHKIVQENEDRISTLERRNAELEERLETLETLVVRLADAQRKNENGE